MTGDTNFHYNNNRQMPYFIFPYPMVKERDKQNKQPFYPKKLYSGNTHNVIGTTIQFLPKRINSNFGLTAEY